MAPSPSKPLLSPRSALPLLLQPASNSQATSRQLLLHILKHGLISTLQALRGTLHALLAALRALSLSALRTALHILAQLPTALRPALAAFWNSRAGKVLLALVTALLCVRVQWRGSRREVHAHITSSGSIFFGLMRMQTTLDIALARPSLPPFLCTTSAPSTSTSAEHLADTASPLQVTQLHGLHQQPQQHLQQHAQGGLRVCTTTVHHSNATVPSTAGGPCESTATGQEELRVFCSQGVKEEILAFLAMQAQAGTAGLGAASGSMPAVWCYSPSTLEEDGVRGSRRILTTPSRCSLADARLLPIPTLPAVTTYIVPSPAAADLGFESSTATVAAAATASVSSADNAGKEEQEVGRMAEGDSGPTPSDAVTAAAAFGTAIHQADNQPLVTLKAFTYSSEITPASPTTATDVSATAASVSSSAGANPELDNSLGVHSLLSSPFLPHDGAKMIATQFVRRSHEARLQQQHHQGTHTVGGPAVAVNNVSPSAFAIGSMGNGSLSHASAGSNFSHRFGPVFTTGQELLMAHALSASAAPAMAVGFMHSLATSGAAASPTKPKPAFMAVSSSKMSDVVGRAHASDGISSGGGGTHIGQTSSPGSSSTRRGSLGQAAPASLALRGLMAGHDKDSGL